MVEYKSEQHNVILSIIWVMSWLLKLKWTCGVLYLLLILVMLILVIVGAGIGCCCWFIGFKMLQQKAETKSCGLLLLPLLLAVIRNGSRIGIVVADLFFLRRAYVLLLLFYLMLLLIWLLLELGHQLLILFKFVADVCLPVAELGIIDGSGLLFIEITLLQQKMFKMNTVSGKETNRKTKPTIEFVRY